jgi:1-acyl-sn-glycerol-3-phosphate acyltransferase
LDAYFYARLFKIIWDCHTVARRAPLDQPTWSVYACRVFELTEQCGGHIRIDGIGNLGSVEGPFVLVANHMSMLETFLIPVMVLPFRLMTTVLKASLLTYPVFGDVLRGFRAISVTREDPKADLKTVMEEGTRHLAEGRVVVIFPQATRSTTVDPVAFNSLGVKLARKAGVPVVPLALKTDFLSTGRLIRDFGPLERSRRIFFRFGEPLVVEGNGRETHDRIVGFIEENVNRWSPLTAL